MLAHDHARQQLADEPRLLVAHLAPQRQQHVDAARAAGLDEARHADLVAQIVQRERDGDDVLERRFLGVEIEDAPVGALDGGEAARPHVEHDRGEVGHVHQRVGLLHDEVLDVALRGLAPDGLGLDPVRRVTRRVLLVELRLALDAVGVARQHQRPIAQVGKHGRGDRAVVVDEIALGVTLPGPEHLAEVAELEFLRG